MRKRFCAAFTFMLISLTTIAQAPTIINVTGIQNVEISSATGTTGGSLAAGTYFYVVIANDTLGGQSGYIRGYQADVTNPNNAVSVHWSTVPFAKTYFVYRSTSGFGGIWYYLGTTSTTSYTDIGAAGVTSVPNVTSTAIGIKGNTGIDITDAHGWSVVKSINLSTSYASYPAVQLGAYIQFGSTGIYGNNSGLIRSYQGLQFEAYEGSQSEYDFYGKSGEYYAIFLQPHDQRLVFRDGGNVTRTYLDQGVADGASAVAFRLSTYHQLTNPAAKLFSVSNRDSECFSIMASGNVRAKKMTVSQSGWSDYVFDKGYKLTSIPQLATYIETNKHLPDIPSASEVAENGINIGDNQALLLKKIEELTLYIIKMDKKNEQLAKRMAQLETIVNKKNR